jgi:4-alpha-glucanotransferase
MRSKIARRSGVLLHPSSFPGPWGIGDLGEAAHTFIEFLGDTHQQLWQILPLGPTGEDGSPYSSFSSSAGNPLLISVEAMVDEGLVSPTPTPSTPAGSLVDQRAVRAAKLPVLERAARALPTKSLLREEFDRFCTGRAEWLDDYALFMALKDEYPGKAWNQWPRELAKRQAAALQRARADLRERIAFHQFTQFVFYRQWARVRTAAHARGVRIVGDIPFYVAFDSADVWAQPQNFALDADTGAAKLMAGVPPDYFSKTGQLWGNPVYDWKRLEEHGFDWWIARFQRLVELVDIVRIDHFRGFQAFWAVPRGERTAVNGRWMECPGNSFFHALEHELGHLPIWAEDLGLVTPEVEKLRDDFDFPGMRVLQFGFDEKGPENPYLPFNYPQHCICYTGTHDNDTTVGWWSGLSAAQKRLVCDYVGDGSESDIHWSIMRMAAGSVADTVVVPMQDILGLGTEARMNMPGRRGGNWAWRSAAAALTDEVKDRLAHMTDIYGRSPRFTCRQQTEIDPASETRSLPAKAT